MHRRAGLPQQSPRLAVPLGIEVRSAERMRRWAMCFRRRLRRRCVLQRPRTVRGRNLRFRRSACLRRRDRVHRGLLRGAIRYLHLGARFLTLPGRGGLRSDDRVRRPALSRTSRLRRRPLLQRDRGMPRGDLRPWHASVLRRRSSLYRRRLLRARRRVRVDARLESLSHGRDLRPLVGRPRWMRRPPLPTRQPRLR